MKRAMEGMTVMVGPLGFINIHLPDLKALIEEHGAKSIRVTDWGDYAEGKPLHTTTDYITIRNLLEV